MSGYVSLIVESDVLFQGRCFFPPRNPCSPHRCILNALPTIKMNWRTATRSFWWTFWCLEGLFATTGWTNMNWLHHPSEKCIWSNCLYRQTYKKWRCTTCSWNKSQRAGCLPANKHEAPSASNMEGTFNLITHFNDANLVENWERFPLMKKSRRFKEVHDFPYNFSMNLLLLTPLLDSC